MREIVKKSVQKGLKKQVRRHSFSFSLSWTVQSTWWHWSSEEVFSPNPQAYVVLASKEALQIQNKFIYAIKLIFILLMTMNLF